MDVDNSVVIEGEGGVGDRRRHMGINGNGKKYNKNKLLKKK